MKKNWEVKKLKDVVEFQRGLTYSKKDEVNFSNNVVLRANNIDLSTHNLNFSELKYINDNFSVPNEKKVSKGSIIICTASGSKSHLGKVALVDNDYDYAFGGFMGQLNPKRTVDSQFLFYLLTSEEYKSFIAKLSDGVNINNLRFEDLKEYCFLLPPHHEQRRIVSILDEAFTAITTAKDNAGRNLQNSRALFESYLENILTRKHNNWLKKPLSELCDIKHGFAFKSEFFTTKGDYVMLTPGNFYESGGYRDRGEKQKYYIGEIPYGFILNKGDMLVAMTEQAAGLLGSPIIVPESNKFLHNQRLGLVTKKQGVPWINEYFYHVFNTRKVRQELHDSASGVKVRHTSPTKIGNVEVSFPASVSEQHSIVSYLEDLCAETKHLETIYQHKLADLDELKKSILKEAFNGELSGAH